MRKGAKSGVSSTGEALGSFKDLRDLGKEIAALADAAAKSAPAATAAAGVGYAALMSNPVVLALSGIALVGSFGYKVYRQRQSDLDGEELKRAAMAWKAELARLARSTDKINREELEGLADDDFVSVLAGLIRRNGTQVEATRAEIAELKALFSTTRQDAYELNAYLRTYLDQRFDTIAAAIADRPTPEGAEEAFAEVFGTAEDARAWHQKRHRELVGQLDRIEGYVDPLPVLLLDEHIASGPGSEFKYTRKRIPILGREAFVRQTLEPWLMGPAPFAFQLLLGGGGAGKSRLALGLVEWASANGWYAGRLGEERLGDWKKWRLKRDTLIVVDYVFRRTDEWDTILAEIYAERESIANGHHLRLLFLDRTDQSPWFRALGDGKAGLLEGDPLRLPPLDDLSLRTILQESARLEQEERPELSPEPVSEFRIGQALLRLKEVEPEGRPLFAQFAGVAVAEGHDVEEWDATRLCGYVLNREVKRWRKAPAVAEPYLNLLAFATLVDGCGAQESDPCPWPETLAVDAEPLLPPRKKYNQSQLARIAGFGGNVAKGYVEALQPDTLGEAFLLARLDGSLLVDEDEYHSLCPLHTEALIAEAWRLQPEKASEFALRCLNNLGGPQHLRRLIPESSEPLSLAALEAATESLLKKGNPFASVLDFDPNEFLASEAETRDPGQVAQAKGIARFFLWIAGNHHQMARFDEATRFLSFSEGMGQSLFAAHDPFWGEWNNRSGQVLDDLGHFFKALSHYEKAERIDRAAYGDDHPSVAISVNNIGGVLQHQGDLEGALKRYREAERIDRAAYGEGHPNVAIRVNNIGNVLHRQGDLEGALQR
ncbi:tetratricopeptide repeat protein, partial [bacterium]